MSKMDFIITGTTAVITIILYLILLYTLTNKTAGVSIRLFIMGFMYVTSMMFTGSLILKVFEFFIDKR